ncbi:hypothetical protein DH2020_029002 [Rehmannia glutinosa]|uniref:Uncharacterized protein n=1 Tax=Rehmannia glutinosa TaxID=99300 RepID=A0ABR0VPU2_REHGL
MVDFLHFSGQALRLLEKESKKMDKLENDLKVLRDAVCSGIKCFEEVSLVKSVAMLEREYEKRKNDIDLEMGKSGKLGVIQWSGFDDDDDDEMRKNVNSFVERLDEVVGKIGVEKDEMKNEVILGLSSLVYCMDGMLKESKEIEKAIKDIVQWENPSVQVVTSVYRRKHGHRSS